MISIADSFKCTEYGFQTSDLFLNLSKSAMKRWPNCYGTWTKGLGLTFILNSDLVYAMFEKWKVLGG